jgi:TIR domain-containing protein
MTDAGMTWDAFLSYANHDRRQARTVYSALDALGLGLWFDDEQLRRRPRAAWRECVHRGVAASRTMLILGSGHWASSPACTYEFAVASERHAPLVAVRLGRASALPLPDRALVVETDGSLSSIIARVAPVLAAHRTAGPMHARR